MPGNNVFAPKTQVLTAIDSTLRHIFVNNLELTFPSGTPARVSDQWRTKIQSMWTCWKRAYVIAKDPRNHSLPDLEVCALIESVCHYYYIVVETWSKEVDNTHEPRSQLIWLVDEAVRDLTFLRISHLETTEKGERGGSTMEWAQSSGPVQYPAEYDSAEEVDTGQSGTQKMNTVKIGRHQYWTDQVHERQDQGRQNWGHLGDSRSSQLYETLKDGPAEISRHAEVSRIARDPEPARNYDAKDIYEGYLRTMAPADHPVHYPGFVEPMSEIVSGTISSNNSELSLKRRRLELEEKRRKIDYMKKGAQQNFTESPIRTLMREIEALGRRTIKVDQEREIKVAERAVAISRIRLEHDCVKLNLVQQRQRLSDPRTNLREDDSEMSSLEESDDMADLSRRLATATLDYNNALERAASEVNAEDIAFQEARNALENTKLDLEEVQLKLLP